MTPASVRPESGERGRHPLRRATHSDWLKLITTRSIISTATVGGIGCIAVTVLHCRSAAQLAGPVDGTGAALFAFTLIQFVALVAGVLTVTSEYSSRTISLAVVATPRRSLLCLAKVTATALASLLYGAVLAAVDYALCREMLDPAHTSTQTLTSTTGRLVGAVVVVITMSLLGVGCGYLARNAAAAISTAAGIIIVPRLLANALPPASGHTLWKLAFNTLMDNLISTPDSQLLNPFAGLGLLVAYLSALLMVSAAAFARRDA